MKRTESKPARLIDLVVYQEGTIVSREIIKKKAGSVTLFAFDEGQGLSEHTAPFDALVQVLTDPHWQRIEKFVRVSFWGLNIGLALMVVTNLFPAGVLQLQDVLVNGYWHARGPEFLNQSLIRRLEWARAGRCGVHCAGRRVAGTGGAVGVSFREND